MNRRRRTLLGTLRGRLTLGLVVILLGVFVVTGVATTLFLRGFLLQRLDTQLTAAGSRFSAGLEHGQVDPGGSDGDADNAVPGQSVGTLGVRLVAGRVAQSAIVADDGSNQHPPLTDEDARRLSGLTAGGAPTSVHLHLVGDYRVQAVDGRDGDVLVTGLPLHPVEDTVARLVTIEVALFAVLLLAAAALTTAVVRRTLVPLRRVADTATAVSGLPLTRSGTTLPESIAPPRPTTEVDHVSVAFDQMVDHLRTALSARDRTEHQLRQFVADASHELRTPLATIRAHVDYTARSGVELPEPAAGSLHRIDVAAARMATLVDDLLLLARLDAGRPLAEEDVDLTRLVLEAVDDARTAGPDHRWHLDLPEEPVEVRGDQQRLHQVLANLLTNARTHTPAGTVVAAVVTGDEQTVTVAIVDTGPGIPAAQQGELFDRFTRGDVSRSSVRQSTGLGLAIAHSIVQAHHGSLTVDSDPGRTCFTVTLPV